MNTITNTPAHLGRSNCGSKSVGWATVALILYLSSLTVEVDASGTYSWEYGYGQAYGDFAFAMGDDSFHGIYAYGDYSFSFGNGTDALSDYTLAFGDVARAQERGAIAIGDGNYSTGYESVAFGDGTRADGDYSFAAGNDSEATGRSSVAMGEYSEATGYASVAMGYYSEASSTGSIAFGRGVISRTSAGLVIGKYNSRGSTSAPYLFVVGNGSSYSERSDAFSVDENGNVWAAGTITAAGGVSGGGSGGYTNIHESGAKIGIGTSTPATKLEIAGGSSGTETGLLQIRSTSSSVNTGSALRFVNSTNATADFGAAEIATVRTTSNGSSNLVFRTANNASLGEALRILANGNVGVGTSNPSSRLEVNGDIETKAINLSSAGSRGSHLNVDGALYRYSGNAYLTVDDTFFIRDSGRGVGFRFYTGSNGEGLSIGNPDSPYGHVSISSDYSEGGQITLSSATTAGSIASKRKWNIDNYKGEFRVFSDSAWNATSPPTLSAFAIRERPANNQQAEFLIRTHVVKLLHPQGDIPMGQFTAQN